MKKPMVNHMLTDKFDDFYTPEKSVKVFLKYIPLKRCVIWECCDPGNSNISKVFRENDYRVISTDIKSGFDFLKEEPLDNIDMIVTNPPYSLKTQFIRKCYESGYPFALLLPLTSLEGVERGKLFRENGISVVVLDRRTNFMEKKSVWFNSSWFFWFGQSKSEIFFESLDK